MSALDDARAAVNYPTTVRDKNAALRALIVEYERTLEGLYAAYANLGEDTDGARNASELFGPMTKIGNPAEYVAGLVKSYREDMEREVETLDEKIAELTAPPSDDEREALARVWAKHRPISWNGGSGCSCGEGNPGMTMMLNTWHEVHLRHAILAAGFRRQGPITNVQVEAAWDALHDWDGQAWLALRAALEAARAVSE